MLSSVCQSLSQSLFLCGSCSAPSLVQFCVSSAMAVMDLVDMSKFPDELVKNINGIVAKCTSQGQKVSGAEEVLNLLKGADLLWEVQGAPEFTGVSRFNRKSYGVGAADSQFLGADILEQGWSWAKAANCVDIEVPPQPHCLPELEFQQQLMEVNGDILPPLKALHSVSLSGGHLPLLENTCAIKAGTELFWQKMEMPKTALECNAFIASRMGRKRSAPTAEECAPKATRKKP